VTMVQARNPDALWEWAEQAQHMWAARWVSPSSPQRLMCMIV